jgi:hypothetical protein
MKHCWTVCGLLACWLLPGLVQGAGPQAGDLYSKVRVRLQEVRICAQPYSKIIVAPLDPSVVVVNREVPVPGAEDLTFQLPERVVNLTGRDAARRIHVEVEGAADLAPQHRLFPFDLPVTDDERVIADFCRQADQFYQSLAQRKLAASTSLKSPLVEVAVAAAGQRIRPIKSVKFETKALPGAAGGSKLSPSPGEPPKPQLEHLIIYSTGYDPEAQRLRDHRLATGTSSVAIDVDSIPGMSPYDDLPAACQGAFRKECFVYMEDAVAGIEPALTEGLFGMGPLQKHVDCVFPPKGPAPGPQVCQKQTTLRVPDRAGLIRAYIRQIKTEHPELKYVALLGDPGELPPRFTTSNTWGQGPTAHGFTKPTDLYYTEVFEPWSAADRLNYAPNYPHIFPCGDIVCDETNTDWDTRHFGWEVRYPFARLFNQPKQPVLPLPAEKLQQIVAVGRIVAKKGFHSLIYDKWNVPGQDPGEPPVSDKDAAVKDYLDNLIAWDLNPRPVEGQVIVSGADGIYPVETLSQFESLLGEFTFIAEHFGSGYVTAANKPEDFDPALCTILPEDDWQAMQPTGPYSAWEYQYQFGRCKPRDARFPNWSNMRLPNADELFAFVNQHGFQLMALSGHGGPRGIGFNSHCDGYNGPCDSSFDKQKIIDAHHWGIDKARFHRTSEPWQYPADKLMTPPDGRPNGFIFSSACSTAPFLGGNHGPYWDALSHRTFAEGFLARKHGGSVGVSMNYDVGFYGSDPSWELEFMGSMQDALELSPAARIGDALLLSNQHQFTHTWLTHQAVNRFWFGDPGARIGSPVCPGPGCPQAAADKAASKSEVK